MYLVVAYWHAKEGRDDDVASLVASMIPVSRAEPGCRLFMVHRSTDDPRKFFLYEQFDDKAAFDAHCATDAFKTTVVGRIQPLLESRVRENYELIDSP